MSVKRLSAQSVQSKVCICIFLREGETRSATAKQEHRLRVSEEELVRIMFCGKTASKSIETDNWTGAVSVGSAFCYGHLRGTNCVGTGGAGGTSRRRWRDNIKMNLEYIRGVGN